jgi:hypothetical protein
VNYSDFKEQTQKNSRGLLSDIGKPAGLPGSNMKVNRIASLQPLPTFGRELSFRGPFHPPARIAPAARSMGLLSFTLGGRKNGEQCSIWPEWRQWGFAKKFWPCVSTS